MAVPQAYSTLSLLKMAREAKHADYNGSQSMGTISLYDMMNSGNSHGSTVSYPEINTDCNPNPDHDHNGGGGGTYTLIVIQLTASPYTTYSTYFTGDVEDLGIGDTIYTNDSGSATLGADNYWVLSITGGSWGDLDWDPAGCTGNCPGFTCNSSGVITAVGCGCP